jgi:hypothetical protein
MPGRLLRTHPRAARAVLGAACLAALSLLVVAPAPSYDPWAWLLWGREVAGGSLDTREGPAFKPLPVAICALLAPLGDAAPVVWVALVRGAAVLVLWFAFRLGRRLAAGSVWAGLLAVVGVAACGRFVDYSAAGAEPALLLALVLGGVEAWRAGHPRAAVACAVGCGLLRIECWPFLLAGGAWWWRARPGDRAALVATAALLPAAWFLPELAGSGDLLRSSARARVPNPGQPALADLPAAASLADAARLLLWPLWCGLAALAVAAWRHPAARRALAPAAVGAAWLGVVAVMAQAGFSGEARYAMPGVALLAASGAAGLALAARSVSRPLVAGILVAAMLAVPVASQAARLAELREGQAYQWQLAGELGDMVRAAGGRSGVLRCGRPYVGPYRGPLMAYRLGVAKATIEPDRPPRSPAVVFRSALTREAEPAPAAPTGARTVAHSSLWRVEQACGS